MDAIKKLYSANKNGKHVCIGLDTDLNKIPKHLLRKKNPVLAFNRQIIEATKNSVAAFKINLAFYESHGIDGLKNLEETLKAIPSNILTISDGKRGDIGNTSIMYAKSSFDHFKFDSATLNPLMGKDSLEPFLEYSDKLNFILVLTSNPGSTDFQKEELKTGEKLFQYIVKKVIEWNINSNCGIVFGATNLKELSDNLDLIKNLPILFPGIGAQGGNLNELTRKLSGAEIDSFLVNVSRGIIYKGNNENFAEEAAKELDNLNKIININKK
jgi:orotidine-5'-phosphate decarboxylase